MGRAARRTETQFVQPGVSLGGARISTREVEFVVSRPVRMIEVRPAMDEPRQMIRYTGTSCHLSIQMSHSLIFDESGQVVARTSEIPAKPVWLLVQSNESSHDRSTLDSIGIEVAGQSRLLDVVDSPIGWGSWDLFRVDLSRASSITFGGGVKRRWRRGARRLSKQQVARAQYFSVVFQFARFVQP